MQKLDAHLAGIFLDCPLDLSATIPVVIRVEGNQLREVSALIQELGGRIRHQLMRLEIIAAWVPLNAVERIAEQSAVRAMEMEQEFSAA
jgi:hypothetical protein